MRASAHLREMARILAAVHGTPRLGNKEDPVDELVYIILARKTREDAYQQTFDALKSAVRPTWDDLLLDAPRRVVERLVHSGGLSGEEDREPLRGARRAAGDLRVVHAGAGPRVARRPARALPLLASRDQPQERLLHHDVRARTAGPSRSTRTSDGCCLVSARTASSACALDGLDSQAAAGGAGRSRAAEPPLLACTSTSSRTAATVCRSRATAVRACEIRNFCANVPAARGRAGRARAGAHASSTCSAVPAGSRRDSGAPASGCWPLSTAIPSASGRTG